MRRAAMLCLLALAGCSEPASPDGGPADSGQDSGRDAGRDSGRDAASPDAGSGDAGRDAGALDAGALDAGPTDPGWVRLPGLPDECAVERARYPERVWDLVWTPCEVGGEVVPGCELARQTPRAGGVSRAWRSEGQTWVETLFGGAPGYERRMGLGPPDGPPVGFWRTPPRGLEEDTYCGLTAMTAGGGQAAFVIFFFDFDDSSRNRAWLYLDSLDAIGEAEVPVHTFPAGFVQRDRTIVHMWLTSELLAMQASPDGTLYTYRDGEWDVLTGRGTVRGIPQNVALIGDNLIWEAWRDINDVRLVHARWGDPATVWRDILPADTKGFGTDGLDLAWFQVYDRQPDGSYDRVELWTAPYRPDLENVTPRIVRLVDFRSSGPLGGGWVARSLRSPARVEVFSLADGSRRTLTSPTGYVIDEPYYATAHEIMFDGATTVRFDPTLLPIDAE